MALIRHGSQIDPKDQDGFTPLHRACAADRSDAVDNLLRVRYQNIIFFSKIEQKINYRLVQTLKIEIKIGKQRGI